MPLKLKIGRRRAGFLVLVVLVFFLASGIDASLHLRHGMRQEQLEAATTTTTVPSKRPFDEFPDILDVAEMANLSQAVYKYKEFQPVEEVCDHWNNETGTSTVRHQKGVTCHWYYHDKHLGTQVMIVSSVARDYLAVIFAGTDDLMTTLLDVDVRKVRFGTDDLIDGANATRVPVSLNCNDCRVHEGFNNAVFGGHVFDQLYVRVEALRANFTRLFTTGHSLGGANSVVTALGLAVEFEKKHIALPHPITTLNFGCPQLGNVQFRDFVNAHYLTHPNTTQTSPYLVIWRFVLGWDLVPRLPEFFEHIGHTVQMNSPECNDKTPYCIPKRWLHPIHHHGDDNHNKQHDQNKTTKQALAYYHHIGDAALNYSGVPSSWSATPYLWVPGALMSHAIARYAAFLNEWWQKSPTTWVHDFVPLSHSSSSSSDNLIDDDTYAEPPDDDAMQLMANAEAKPSRRWLEFLNDLLADR